MRLLAPISKVSTESLSLKSWFLIILPCSVLQKVSLGLVPPSPQSYRSASPECYASSNYKNTLQLSTAATTTAHHKNLDFQTGDYGFAKGRFSAWALWRGVKAKVKRPERLPAMYKFGPKDPCTAMWGDLLRSLLHIKFSDKIKSHWYLDHSGK